MPARAARLPEPAGRDDCRRSRSGWRLWQRRASRRRTRRARLPARRAGRHRRCRPPRSPSPRPESARPRGPVVPLRGRRPARSTAAPRWRRRARPRESRRAGGPRVRARGGSRCRRPPDRGGRRREDATRQPRPPRPPPMRARGARPRQGASPAARAWAASRTRHGAAGPGGRCTGPARASADRTAVRAPRAAPCP
jgi:hypothetical protein